MRFEPSVGSGAGSPGRVALPGQAAGSAAAGSAAAGSAAAGSVAGLAAGPAAAGPAAASAAASSGVLQRTQAGAHGGFRVEHVVQVIPSGTG
jgi:hypothetical protein